MLLIEGVAGSGHRAFPTIHVRRAGRTCDGMDLLQRLQDDWWPTGCPRTAGYWAEGVEEGRESCGVEREGIVRDEISLTGRVRDQHFWMNSGSTKRLVVCCGLDGVYDGMAHNPCTTYDSQLG